MSLRRSSREDYLIRLIQEAGRVVALLRARLLGQPTAPETIRDEAEQAMQALLGAEEPLLRRLDARSAVLLIDYPERVAVWADLLDVQADAAEAMNNLPAANSNRARANELRKAAGLSA